MIPTEIHAANARHVPREVALLDREHFFRYRKDTAATENGNTSQARLAFMRPIGRRHPRLVRLGEVRRVVNRRTNHGAVRMQCVAKEALNNSAHPKQGRKAHEYNSSGFIGAV